MTIPCRRVSECLVSLEQKGDKGGSMQAWKSPSESEQNVLGHFGETGRAPPDTELAEALAALGDALS